MADKSAIEWLNGGSTWNPIRARVTDGEGVTRIGWHCEHASIGCIGCYSEQTNKGFFQLGTKLPYTRPSRDKVEIFLDEETLRQPLHWKKPRKIFPCSMTDAFAEFVPDEWLDKMLAVAALCPQHEFLFLTKRAERARYYLTSPLPLTKRPLRNVTVGFSAENQEWFDKRWPHMRKVAEAGWKVNCSYEPALGPIDFGPDLRRLSQVIFGGHSGPNAKLCDVRWAYNTIAQCKAVGTPCFIKQLGTRPVLDCPPGEEEEGQFREDGSARYWTLDQIKHKKGGDPAEWFEDLRVREYASEPAM